ncbi:MAG: hypothetical protein GY721_02955 [Deltaproteobacteria bacterium]|nr:hypothetical protein [Deltaproteobacteria bacterium]
MYNQINKDDRSFLQTLRPRWMEVAEKKEEVVSPLPPEGIKMAVINIRHNWRAWGQLTEQWKKWDIMIVSETFRKAVPWKSRVVPQAKEWVEFRTGNNEKAAKEERTGREQREKEKRNLRDEESEGAGGLSLFIRQPLAQRVVEVHKCKGGRALAVELEMGKGVRWMLIGVYGYPDKSTEEARKVFYEVIPGLLRRIQTKYMYVFTIAGDMNVQVGEAIEKDLLNTIGWWELKDAAIHMNKESPTFWKKGIAGVHEMLDRVYGCGEMMEAISHF